MFARKPLAAAASSLAATGPAGARRAAPLSLANVPAVRAGASLDEPADLRGLTPLVPGAVVLGILVFVLAGLNDNNALPASA